MPVPEWFGAALPLIPMAVFAAAILREQVAPRRSLGPAVFHRWAGNGALYVFNTGIAWAAGAVLAGALGPSPESQASAEWFWAKTSATVLAIDLLLYGLHRLQHAVPLLWRFHAVHHADTAVDSTTAVRHHPGDFLLGYAVASAFAAAAGAPALAIGVYGAAALSLQFLQHANIELPGGTDAVLRRVLATPAMHRVHHQRDRVQGDANFATLFSLWDRLFGTYHEPDARRADDFGVSGLDDARYQRLDWMLATPILVGRARRQSNPALRNPSRIWSSAD